ncbi:hypothetical protein VNO80_08276 [Phaseolus coccineus]|uniref:Uncharacterized protein n=1 Tax=Phaseolus coccineus TaxID=3886 RepID=A0AAN9NQ94_PHACN
MRPGLLLHRWSSSSVVIWLGFAELNFPFTSSLHIHVELPSRFLSRQPKKSTNPSPLVLGYDCSLLPAIVLYFCDTHGQKYFVRMNRKFGGGRQPTGTPSLAWSCVVVVFSLLAGASVVHNIYKPNLTLPPVDGVDRTKQKPDEKE